MSIKAAFLVLALIIRSSVAQTQLTTIDSLEQLLKKGIADTTRVLVLANLSQAHLYSKPDSALSLAQKGLTLAVSISFHYGEIICLNKKANVFRTIGNMPKAFETNLLALKKAEKINDNRSIQRILSDIGIIYFIQEDYGQALEYYLKSKVIAEKIQDENRMMISYINIGDAYMRLNFLDSALQYTQKAHVFVIMQKDEITKGTVFNNLGNIYSRMDQPILAMNYYRSSILFFEMADDHDGLCEASMGIARLFQKAGQSDSCLYYAKRVMGIAKEAGFTQRILDAGFFLTNYYKAALPIDSAFVYLETTMAAKDQYFSQEKIKQMQTLAFDESLRQREIAASKALAERERKDNIQYAVIAIGVICFVVLFILLANNIIFHERWIRFLSVLGLLLFFEFINLFVHPILSDITHHSPALMFATLVAIAAMLIPLHHRLEHWITNKLLRKNKRLRLQITQKQQLPKKSN